jgi:hypothetical protein
MGNDLAIIVVAGDDRVNGGADAAKITSCAVAAEQ